MTYSYTAQIANSKLGTFGQLLFRWRASIYKLLYRELIIYMIIYYVINFVYRFALDNNQRLAFEEIAVYCGTYSDYVPLTFVLGFYVSWVVNRWWSVFCAINWPDRLAIHIATLVHGNDERGRLIRRSLVRWLNLSQVLTLRNVSVPVKLRFLTLDSVRQAGFLTDSEYEYYAKLFALPEKRLPDLAIQAENAEITCAKGASKKINPKLLTVQKEETLMKRWDSLQPPKGASMKKDSIAAGANPEISKIVKQRYSRGLENDLVWLLPLQWFGTLVSKAHNEGRIKSDLALTQIISALCDYRDNLMSLKLYDWISIPLVYTQVATLAVYTYFIPCLMSRQYLDPSKRYPGSEIDLYVPIFLILEFLFYVGWLKVAESLIYPLGSQDDHFEINGIIDRNAAIGYVFADIEYDAVPPLTKDHHFNQREVFLPHTLASIGNHDAPPVGSAADVHPPRKLTGTSGVHVIKNHVPHQSQEDSTQAPGFMRRLSSAFVSPMDLITRKRSLAPTVHSDAINSTMYLESGEMVRTITVSEHPDPEPVLNEPIKEIPDKMAVEAAGNVVQSQSRPDSAPKSGPQQCPICLQQMTGDRCSFCNYRQPGVIQEVPDLPGSIKEESHGESAILAQHVEEQGVRENSPQVEENNAAEPTVIPTSPAPNLSEDHIPHQENNNSHALTSDQGPSGVSHPIKVKRKKKGKAKKVTGKGGRLGKKTTKKKKSVNSPAKQPEKQGWNTHW